MQSSNYKHNIFNKLINYIKNDNINSFIIYINQHHVTIDQLNNKQKNRDFLIEAIKNNASVSVVHFIIKKWYHTMNYYKKDIEKIINQGNINELNHYFTTHSIKLTTLEGEYKNLGLNYEYIVEKIYLLLQ